MADQEQPLPAGRASNGRNLAERLAAVGAKPVMAMEERPADLPIALIVKDWLDGANEHYRRAGHELTATWARKMLDLEEQRMLYMRRMLEALIKS